MADLAPERLALDWQTARLGAAALLLIYLAVAALLYKREARFLASIEPRTRRFFTLQDVLIQLGVLLSLLPVLLSREADLTAMLLCVSGVTILWIVGVWTGISRSMYTYRLMLGAREELDQRSRELLEGRPSGPGSGGTGEPADD